MYHYWGFGLNITSEIEFPEFLPSEFEETDLTIRLGKTPEKLTGNDITQRLRVSISPEEYLLDALNVARYYAAHGKEITIEPQPESDAKSIRLFLLSNVMAAILHQRNKVLLHASAIHYKEGVVLFTGASGAGKSTTATALQQRGYKIFSDDVCVLQPSIEGRVPEVVASYPMIKLWEDSFAMTGLEKAGKADQIRPELAKYARWYHKEFSTEPRPVRKIFVIETSLQAAALTIKTATPMESFQELQKNTYRPMQTIIMKKRDIHFAMISRLAGAVPVTRITRPQYGNSLEELIEYLQSTLQENEQ